MVKQLIRRYAIWFAISVACLTGLIYNHIMYPEDFQDNPLVVLIGVYMAAIGNLVGLIIHAAMWWNAVKKQKTNA